MSRGFTLIELLIAVTLSVIVLGIITGTILQLRRAADRSSARLMMGRRSALIHAQMMQRITAMAPGQAMVVEWKGGKMRLLYMRGVLDNNDWNYYSDTIANGANLTKKSFWPTICSDQMWELWEWSQSDHVLRLATTRVMRKFWMDGKTINGMSYNDTMFTALPQPHRTLQPETWRSELNTNILFPDYTLTTNDGLAGRRGMADNDKGDWGELSSRLVPVLAGEASERQDPADPMTWDGVVDFALRIERIDGSHQDFVPEMADATVAIDGARSDGRVTGVGGGPSPGSRLSLLKLSWTMRDRRTGLSLPFTFSIPTPAFSGGK